MTTTEYLDEWFSRIEENITGANPATTALMFALLRESKRIGSNTFHMLPERMMLLLGVAQYKTFKKALDILKKDGLIDVLSEAKNQHTRTLIKLNALVKNTEAEQKHDQSVTKAREKHDQSEEKAMPKQPLASGREVNSTCGGAELVVNSYLEEINSSCCSSTLEEEPNNNNNSFSGEEAKSIEQQITDLVNSRIPPIQLESPQREPIQELTVLEFIKVAGRPVSRGGVEKYIRATHSGQRGEVWKSMHKQLDFDKILSAFLIEIDQQRFDQQSYLVKRFNLFSNDFLTGSRAMATYEPSPVNHSQTQYYDDYEFKG